MDCKQLVKLLLDHDINHVEDGLMLNFLIRGKRGPALDAAKASLERRRMKSKVIEMVVAELEKQGEKNELPRDI